MTDNRCRSTHDGWRCELEETHRGNHIADTTTTEGTITWEPSTAERWRIDPTTMRWGHSLYPGSESWTGKFHTREEAIRAAVAFYADRAFEHHETGSFYIGRGSLVRPSDFVTDRTATLVFEHMAELADEAMGECAADWPEETSAEEDSLVAHLKRWADDNLRCSFWMADGHEEKIQNAADTEVSCSHCSTTARASSHRGATAPPPGWFVIDEVGDTGGVFCSIVCVDAFRDEEELRR